MLFPGSRPFTAASSQTLRGFDIDHGTDLALWVDGMPVNNVSHGHGQGYADFHFIIPELNRSDGPFDNPGLGGR